jgi:hypothetical protein
LIDFLLNFFGQVKHEIFFWKKVRHQRNFQKIRSLAILGAESVFRGESGSCGDCTVPTGTRFTFLNRFTKRKKTEKIMAQTHLYFGCRDMRQRSPIERAFALVKDERISYRKAAKACGVSYGAIQRALVAVHDNRPFGQLGHPRLLSDDQLEGFDQALDSEIRAKKRVKYTDARRLVCLFLFLLLLVVCKVSYFL